MAPEPSFARRVLSSYTEPLTQHILHSAVALCLRLTAGGISELQQADRHCDAAQRTPRSSLACSNLAPWLSLEFPSSEATAQVDHALQAAVAALVAALVVHPPASGSAQYSTAGARHCHMVCPTAKWHCSVYGTWHSLHGEAMSSEHKQTCGRPAYSINSAPTYACASHQPNHSYSGRRYSCILANLGCPRASLHSHIRCFYLLF